MADTRGGRGGGGGGGEGGRKPPPPNYIYWSFSFEKWKRKKVFISSSGTVAYYLVHYFALLPASAICKALCYIVHSSDIIYKSASGD